MVYPITMYKSLILLRLLRVLSLKKETHKNKGIKVKYNITIPIYKDPKTSTYEPILSLYSTSCTINPVKFESIKNVIKHA